MTVCKPLISKTIREVLEVQGTGTSAVNYKLRDWLFSRQKVLGEPFPILHELDEEGNPTGVMETVDEADLPVDPYRLWRITNHMVVRAPTSQSR